MPRLLFMRGPQGQMLLVKFLIPAGQMAQHSFLSPQTRDANHVPRAVPGVPIPEPRWGEMLLAPAQPRQGPC